jgi:hypothetical protein
VPTLARQKAEQIAAGLRKQRDVFTERKVSFFLFVIG